jgi:hypothetical protein
MFNLNIGALIQSLTQSTNSTSTPASPDMDNPNKGIPDPTQNPAKGIQGQVENMLSNSKSQNNTLNAKQDKTPLQYEEKGVELTGTAIPEKEQPEVKEKGFKANLMDAITKSFTGGDNIDKANSQKGNSGPNTSLQEETGKRPTPPTMHNPPSQTPPNPKVRPNIPPNPSIPQPKVPRGNFPKVNIPKPKGPR